jgi:polysaccharide biosynthesis protein PslA
VVTIAYEQNLGARVEAGTSFARAEAPFGLRARIVIYMLMLAAEVSSIVLSFLAANTVLQGRIFDPIGLGIISLIAPLYAAFSATRGAFCPTLLADWTESAKRAFTSFLWAAGATEFVLAYAKGLSLAHAGVAAVGATVSVLLLCASRYLQSRLLHGRLRREICSEVVILDGADASAGGPMARGRMIDARAAGIEPDISDPVMLERFCRLLKGVDRAIVSCDASASGDWVAMLKASGIRGELLMPEIARYGSVGVGAYGAASTLVVSDEPLKLVDRIQKRVLDVVVSSTALLLFAPMLFLTALAIKLESPGPALFRQPRTGLGNQPFLILKFRTMRLETCDEEGRCSTRRGDDRITRLGGLLRKSSIDELPQLLNVVKGEMSLVGPRPHALGSLAGEKLFWEVDRRYWQRHAAKPGITGLAQIRGYRGPTEHELDLSHRLQSDLDYLRGWTIWRDFKIIAATLKVMFHKNAF